MVRTYLILAFAIFFLSQAGNLVRLAETSASTVVFYRMFLAFIFISPFMIKAGIKQSKIIWNGKLIFKIICMGLFFGFHILTWVLSIQSTKIANASICFSIHPIIISAMAFLFFKEKINAKGVFGIALGILGITVIGLDDFSLSPQYFKGDVWAIFSSLLYSCYFIIGKSLRENVNNAFLMGAVYFIAAIAGISLVISNGTTLTEFNTQTKFALVALAIFPTILGHASIIYIIRRMKAFVISTAMFSEPLLAGVVAYFLFNEKITLYTIIGYVIIIVGIIPLFTERRTNEK